MGDTESAVLLLCSDGVWDNWTFQGVATYFCDPARQAQFANGQGVEQVVQEFMQQNYQYGKQNFGNQADNMTAIACQLGRW